MKGSLYWLLLAGRVARLVGILCAASLAGKAPVFGSIISKADNDGGGGIDVPSACGREGLPTLRPTIDACLVFNRTSDES